MISLEQSGIYLIIYTNPETGKKKWYVGSTVHFSNRWSNHRSDMLYGKANKIIQNIYNKYGLIVFKFLPIEVIEDDNLLKIREEYWYYKIKDKNNKMLNVSTDFTNNNFTTLGLKFTDNMKKNQSESRKRFFASDKGIALREKWKIDRKGTTVKSTPILIHTKTLQIMSECKSRKELSEKISCNVKMVSKYLTLKEKKGTLKGYVTLEHFEKIKTTPKTIYKPTKEHITKCITASIRSRQIETPEMIHLETKEKIPKCVNRVELGKVINCCPTFIKYYLDKKTTSCKGYVSIEHYNNPELYANVKEPIKKPTPKLIHIKTLQIVPECSSRTELTNLLNIGENTVARLLDKPECKTRLGWKIYIPEVHITETDYPTE